MRAIWLTALGCAGLAGVAAAQTPVGPEGQAAPATAEAPLADVVVTASKRSESVLKTPQSVAVLSGDALEAQGAHSFRDYINEVPSLNFESNGGSGVRYNIRGVAALSPVQNDIATVGYYLDEVPISESTVGADITPFDLQRIEVLRGPQGTLYGEGSIGGTIKVVTNKPDATKFAGATEAQFSGTEHGGFNRAEDFMLNVPLIENELAVRGVVSERRDSGYINDFVTGQHGVNSNAKAEGRLAVRWTPTEDIIVDASGFDEYDHFGGRDYDLSRGGPFIPNTSGIGEYLGLGTRPALSLIPNLAPAYSDASAFPEKFTTHRYIANLTITWDLGWATLLSSSSYYKLLHHDFYDSRDDTPVVESGGALLVGPSFVARQGTRADVRLRSEQTSQEFRLTSPEGERLRWLVGFFYRDRTNGFSYLENSLDGTAAIGIGPLFNAAQSVDFRQLAGFGEATYDILPDLHLTAGARIFNEDVTGSGQTTVVNTFSAAAPFLGQISFPSKGGQNETDPLFKVSLAYDLNPDLHTYFLFSEGTRPGGLNQRLVAPYFPQFFGSDSTRNYEIGLKGDAFDRRATFALAAFQIDWSDTQIYVDDPPSGQNIYNIPGGARVRGAEAEASARPADGVLVGASYGYLDTTTLGPVTYFNSVSGPTTATLPGGQPLPDAPRHKLGVYGEYSLPIGATTLTARVDDAYVGARSPGILLGYTLHSYDKLDARLTLEWGDYSVALYGENLLDRGIETLGPTLVSYGIALDRPLTAGARLAARF